jgi:hypothetical protein
MRSRDQATQKGKNYDWIVRSPAFPCRASRCEPPPCVDSMEESRDLSWLRQPA